MRKEPTSSTNYRDLIWFWISHFKPPARKPKRSCLLLPWVGNIAPTEEKKKTGIRKGLERWKSPVTSQSCFAAYHRIPGHLRNGSDSLLCYQEHLSDTFSNLGRKQIDDTAVSFSHPHWLTKSTDMTKKTWFIYSNYVQIFFLCHKTKGQNL